jgi:hypothetical protein
MVVWVNVILCLTGLLLSMAKGVYDVAGVWFLAYMGWVLLAVKLYRK